jgi:hypothetical protein
LKATRRRTRKTDSLAAPDAVRAVVEQLRASLLDIIPQRDKDLVRMLRAVRHIQRYPATDTRRGRPSRWKREDLLKVATRLEDILDRETSSRTSLASFIDHYLRLLDFPVEVINALTAGNINIFEAEQLARVTPVRLQSTLGRAKSVRVELLSTHMQTKESGERLRRRVNELLRQASVAATSMDVTNEVQEIEDLEDFDPHDSTHLFWEQLKQLGFAFREIRREDVTDEEIEELLKASEPIMAVLAKIQRRREKSKVIKVKL